MIVISVNIKDRRMGLEPNSEVQGIGDNNTKKVWIKILVLELDSWHNPQCRLRFIILNGISAGWWRGTTHFLITTTGHYRLGWSQLNQKNGDKIDRSAACCCTRWLLFANHAANLCCSSIQSGENIVVSEKRETIQLNESKPSQKEETSNHLCGRSFYFRVVKKCYQMFSRVFQCSARVFNL